MLKIIPHGYDEIIKTFGPLTEIPKRLITFDLPYPMLYQGITVHRATCHDLVVDNFVGALTEIHDEGLAPLVLHFGGIYSNRVKRDGSTPSCHAFGIAGDFEPERYPLYSDKRFPKAVIDAFSKFGFFYGGDFGGRLDPMHFQMALGY